MAARKKGKNLWLKLMLAPGGKFTWEFIPEEGKTVRDSGSGVCHNQPKGRIKFRGENPSTGAQGDPIMV